MTRRERYIQLIQKFDHDRSNGNVSRAQEIERLAELNRLWAKMTSDDRNSADEALAHRDEDPLNPPGYRH